jgi:hypothetical protein
VPVKIPHSHNDGAGYVSRNLTWWAQCDDIAVITPVRAETSPFVQNLIARVGEAPIGNPAVGPHYIPWEFSQEADCEQFLSGLDLPAEVPVQVSELELCLAGQREISRSLLEWCDRRRRLTGRTTLAVAEIRQQVEKIHQRSRAYRRVRERGVRAITIHQAKNREFHSVIVLWPYEVRGTTDRQRRLLYNAITRAKHRALVLVQNPQRRNHLHS